VDSGDGLTVGTLGEARPFKLPAGRQVLGVVGDTIVNAATGDDGLTSTVYLTSRADSSEREAATKVPGQLLIGVTAGDVLFATGIGQDAKADPGVVAISAADGSVEQVVPAGAAREGPGPLGRNLALSPSRRTLVSSICRPSGCQGGEVMAADTGEVLLDLTDVDGGASSVNDKVVLVRVGADVTTSIAGVSIQTGKTLWRQAGGEYYSAYFSDDGSLVISASFSKEATPFRLLLMDPLTGAIRRSMPLAGLRDAALWDELSGDGLAVVGEGGAFPGLAEQGVAVGGVVNLETGQLTKNAVQIHLGAQP
jgi:hypothetical protein